MGKHYSHLTVTERELLAKLYYAGHGPCDIAQALGRDKGTISRELSRNASPLTRCYAPCRAQLRNDERRKKASRRSRLRNEAVRSYVHEKLAVGWSPEIIAGRLPLDHPGLHISYEAIYQYIYEYGTKVRVGACGVGPAELIDNHCDSPSRNARK